jgi:hypothetical protein
MARELHRFSITPMSQHSEVRPCESISQVITKDYDFMPEYDLEEEMEEDVQSHLLHSSNPIPELPVSLPRPKRRNQYFSLIKITLQRLKIYFPYLYPSTYANGKTNFKCFPWYSKGDRERK